MAKQQEKVRIPDSSEKGRLEKSHNWGSLNESPDNYPAKGRKTTVYQPIEDTTGTPPTGSSKK